jgi:hypothetical protein
MDIFPGHCTDSSTRRSLTFTAKDYEHRVEESYVRRKDRLSPDKSPYRTSGFELAAALLGAALPQRS